LFSFIDSKLPWQILVVIYRIVYINARQPRMLEIRNYHIRYELHTKLSIFNRRN